MGTHLGFECLTLITSSRKEEVKITIDRENRDSWFVDYTRDRRRIPHKRVTLSSKELRHAFGVFDRRVKHVEDTVAGKYLRRGKTLNVPNTGGVLIRITPEIASVVRELTKTQYTRMPNN